MELPSLSENANVYKITSVDPATGAEKDILLDKTLSVQGASSDSIERPVLPANINNAPTELASPELSKRDASLADFGLSASPQTNNSINNSQAVSGGIM